MQSRFTTCIFIQFDNISKFAYQLSQRIEINILVTTLSHIIEVKICLSADITKYQGVK